MKREEYNKFKTVIAGMCEVYDRVPSEVLLQVFWEDFKELTIDQFSKAVSDHRKDPDQGMFFPKTANLMKQIKGSSKQQHRSIEERAELAWSEITTHLQRKGPYKTFSSKDGVSLAAFHAVGGMSKLSTADYDAIVWIKKEFISMYATYENTPLENLPQNIMGLEDLQKHKLEQKGRLTDIFSIANDLIDKAATESSEALPEPLSEEERQKVGQDKGVELRKLMGMPQREDSIPEPPAQEVGEKGDGPKIITHDIEKEKERRRAALEAAKSNLQKGGDL
mgnify:CR=1 FL=1|tara:strand:- start:18273 stop:19109 length:837 start_codon:yes stop_codon:yes gene_type:complete